MPSSGTGGKLVWLEGWPCVRVCVCVGGWQGVEAQMERVTGRKEPRGEVRVTECQAEASIFVAVHAEPLKK